MKTVFNWVIAATLLVTISVNVDAQQINDTTVLRHLLNGHGIDNKEVQMEVVTFGPGGISSPHRHPCPTFGYLLQGELESVFEGERHIYKAGDSFYEKPNGLHSLTRNNSKSEPAKLLVFFINDPAKPNSIHLKTK
jgi:quercetin dioxygenase-like cupin family protein